MQLAFVSGVQATMSGMPYGARSHLPDLSELYALPWTPSLRAEHLPTSGRLVPAPVMVTVQTITTTTITSTVAIPAAQAGLVYMPYTGQALPPGAPMACPVRGAAEYQHPTS